MDVSLGGIDYRGLPGRVRRRRPTTASTTRSPTRSCGSSSTTSGTSPTHPTSAARRPRPGSTATRPSTTTSPGRCSSQIEGEADPLVMIHDYHLYTCPALHPRGAARRLPAPLRPHPLVAAGLVADTAAGLARGDLSRPAGERHHRLPHLRLRAQLPPVLPGADGARGRLGAASGRPPRRGDVGARLPAGDRRRAPPPSAAASDAGRAATRRSCLRRRREHLIIRVDRADLSKNVLRGFTAFDVFLQQHPEFRERVSFIAHLQPSRQDVPEYAGVPGADRGAGRGRQPPPRDHRLDADRPADLRELLRGGGPLQALRPADRQLDLRRHEPGRQGGARRSTSATGS